jgi:hypothetical protein
VGFGLKSKTVSNEELATKISRQAVRLGLKGPKILGFKGYEGTRSIERTLRTMDALENGIPKILNLEGGGLKVVTARKNAGLFEGVKSLFDKKRKVIEEVISDVKVLTRKDAEGLKSILNPSELEMLLGYSEFRRKTSAEKEVFDQMMVKVAVGTFNTDDAKKVRMEFGRTVAAKMTILYNDRLLLEDRSRERLEENRKIRELRKEIRRLEGQNREFKSALKLLENLKEGEFKSELQFVRAFRDLGSNVSYMFEHLDWREKPFIVQFAVGANEMIRNPIGGEDRPEYILGYKSELWKSWADQHRKEFTAELKRRGRATLQGIKESFVKEDYLRD